MKKIKQYLPLIMVFVFILVVIAIVEFSLGRFDWQESMRLFMGLFFALFGGFKLLDLKGFIMAYKKYDLLAPLIPGYAAIYPFIELGLGVSYLANWQPYFTNVFTIVVMSIGAIGVIKAVVSGKDIQCACLGTVVNLPMSTVTIIEDVGMLLMAILMLTML